MAYHHDSQLYKKRKRSKRFLAFSLSVSVIFLLIAGFVIIDWLGSIFRNNTVVSSTNQASVQSANINIFQTEYFRFQAGNTWREVSDQFENPENEYIYRSYDNGLIEHELWITVNKEKQYSIEKHYPTRIMSITITPDGRPIQAGAVSERCVTALPEGQTNERPQTVTQENITYFCYPNSTAFFVTLGVSGGTNELPMPMSNGRTVPVTIIYKNVTAYPDARQLEQILSTFRMQ